MKCQLEQRMELRLSDLTKIYRVQGFSDPSPIIALPYQSVSLGLF